MSLTALKELTVLSLVRAHPSHGYAIAEVLESGVGFTVGLNKSTVYATLRRFAERGWTETRVVEDERFPNREVHSLTETGELAFGDLLATCTAPTQALMPLVASLLFLDSLDAPVRRIALENMREHRGNRLGQLENFPTHDGSAGVALKLARDQLRLELATIDGLLGATSY